MTLTTEYEQSLSSSLDWLMSHIRWVWLLLTAIFVVGESLLSVAPPENFVNLLVLLGVGIVFNGVYVGLIWGGFFPRWLAALSTITDIVFAIVLLVMMNRHAQLLLPLMLFPVIMASVRWNTEIGLLVALAIVLSYSVPLILLLLNDDVERVRLLQGFRLFGVTALTLFTGGALAGIAVQQRVDLTQGDNVKEMERLRRDNERGKLITEMALTMSSTTNYRKVLRTMIDLAFSAMVEEEIEDETTVGMVLLFEGNENGDDRRLTVVAGRNIARTDEGRRVNSDTGVIGRTVSTAEVAITYNAQRDKILTSLASTPGCRSAICSPLRAGFNTYGVVLFCTTEPNFYTEDHKKLLTTFCSQAIIALQNAQLFDDLRYEQQRILEKDAEARRKLARELHDGPTQSIAAIAMRLNFIKLVLENKEVDKAYDEVVKVEEIAQQTTQEIRTMLFAMRPVILETQGLQAALNQFAKKLSATEDFKVVVKNQGYQDQLNAEAEGVVFAIIEEAIGNARKHAQATLINVNLLARQGNLFVEVKDTGVGFDLEATKSSYDQRSSLGLINMDERAREIGGRAILESEAGKGTRLRLQVPFEPQPEETY
ncbi:MAG: GAF domain-containing sensor histidine kinase [Anaerolineae bacterium]|nr:GAF domain-containing sensor histidine kinase [Anaerolineae bacterium]